MAQAQLMKGMLASKSRKLGIIGFASSVVGAAVAYYAGYVKTAKLYSDFKNSDEMSEETQKKRESMLTKYLALGNKEEEDLFGPKLNLEDAEEGDVMAAKNALFRHRVEYHALKQIDEKMKDLYPSVVVDHYSDGTAYKSEEERKQVEEAVHSVRVIALLKAKQYYEYVQIADHMKLALPDEVYLFAMYYMTSKDYDKALKKSYEKGQGVLKSYDDIMKRVADSLKNSR